MGSYAIHAYLGLMSSDAHDAFIYIEPVTDGGQLLKLFPYSD